MSGTATKDKVLANDSVYQNTIEKLKQARVVSERDYQNRFIPEKNFAHMFADRVKKQGDKRYMVYRNSDLDTRLEFTYKEFFKEVVKVAKFMKDDLGIKPGDRVSTYAYNHCKTVIVNYAAFMVGAVLVPINIGEAAERVEFIQENSETKAVFVMPDLLEQYSSIGKKVSTIKNFLVIDSDSDANAGGLEFKSLDNAVLKHEADYSDVDAVLAEFVDLSDLDSEALIVYTSGTTGAPKGVLLQQYNILVDAHCIAEWYNYNEDDCMMIILPIHHVNGLIVTLITSLYFGGSCVLNRKFSCSRYWRIIEEEGASCGSVVPTILSFLCEGHENRDSFKIKDAFFLICGAGPLTVDLALKFEKQFDIRILHGYGLSETTAYSCFLPTDLSKEEHTKWLSEYGYPSIGIAIPANDMDIQDEEGKSLTEDERGEIVIKGHNVMKFYFKRPEVNEETFVNGWFRSGDEGFFRTDSQGRKFFFITGRLKELIIRGGVNYSTFEIDEVLGKIPGVKAGMVVGFENNAYGEEIGAYLVKEEGSNITEEEVMKECAKVLPFTKTPKVVIFGDHFPVTSTGKYKRNELKPLFKDYKDVQFSDKK